MDTQLLQPSRKLPGNPSRRRLTGITGGQSEMEKRRRAPSGESADLGGVPARAMPDLRSQTWLCPSVNPSPRPCLARELGWQFCPVWVHSQRAVPVAEPILQPRPDNCRTWLPALPDKRAWPGGPGSRGAHPTALRRQSQTSSQQPCPAAEHDLHPHLQGSPVTRGSLGARVYSTSQLLSTEPGQLHRPVTERSPGQQPRLTVELSLQPRPDANYSWQFCFARDPSQRSHWRGERGQQTAQTRSPTCGPDRTESSR